MNRCIVSLATSNRQFPAALARQQESARGVGYTGGFLTWPPGEWPRGCPGHFESPFAFKPFCLREAERRGVECSLWLDASCVAVRSLDPLFEKIRRDGYLLFRNRGKLGEWAGDLALEAFGVSRSRAMELAEVNAAVLGLNLRSAVGREFLERWHRAAVERVPFRGTIEPIVDADDYQAIKANRGGRVSADGRVRGHRHDQTVAGLIAAELGLILTGRGLATYSVRRRRIARSTTIVVARPPRDGDLASLERVIADRDRWRFPRMGLPVQ